MRKYFAFALPRFCSCRDPDFPSDQYLSVYSLMTPPAVEENLTHQLVGSSKGATVGSDHGLSLGCLGPICRKARGVVSRWRAEKERKRRTSRNLPRIEASTICAWRQNLQKAGKRGFFRWQD